jgi:hypothetical protein
MENDSTEHRECNQKKYKNKQIKVQEDPRVEEVEEEVVLLQYSEA